LRFVSDIAYDKYIKLLIYFTNHEIVRQSEKFLEIMQLFAFFFKIEKSYVFLRFLNSVLLIGSCQQSYGILRRLSTGDLLGLGSKNPKNGLKIFPEFLQKCSKNL